MARKNWSAREGVGGKQEGLGQNLTKGFAPESLAWEESRHANASVRQPIFGPSSEIIQEPLSLKPRIIHFRVLLKRPIFY